MEIGEISSPGSLYGSLTLQEALSGRPSYSNIKQNDPINLFDLIKQNPSGSYEDYAQKLKVSSATIKRKIAELKAEGKIVCKDSNKNGFGETES